MTVFKLLTLLVIGTCSSPWPQTDLTVNCLEPAGQTSNQVRVEPMNMAKQRTDPDRSLLEEEEGAELWIGSGGGGLAEPAASAGPSSNQVHANSKLRIVRLFAPEAVQNATQNVTIDCMFNYDRKLDQRMTIKWFFNDQLEPIYQWIPELNKRVYSDRYERFLDKSYEVSEDLDFMLHAYRRLLADETQQVGQAQADAFGEEPSRRLLARRLERLAKLGGQHSRQLVDALRLALNMHQPELSRFRALRLLWPTSELSGRFTCSVSSLDGDDLRSTELVVYEPAKEFTFNVSRLEQSAGHFAGQLYNLTCQAKRVFPRPSLALFRYRAGPLAAEQRQVAGSPIGRLRPRLAATLLRAEPLEAVQTELSLLAPAGHTEPDANSIPQDQPEERAGAHYQVTSWALVDEASLSSKLASQFECQLAIPGTGYERRQSLTLRRGWHTNSAALVSRSTLFGLLSILASLLCLAFALERKNSPSNSSASASHLPAYIQMVQTKRQPRQQLTRKSHSTDDDDSMDVDEPQVKLRTSDGMQYNLAKSVVSCSKPLRTMIESVQNNHSSSNAEYIHLPFVDAYTLDRIVEWQAIHAARPDHSDTTCLQRCSADLSSKEKVLLDILNEDQLLKLMHAANYLNIEHLYDSCCRYMAKSWEGKSIEEIRQTYGIANDFTQNEENRIKQDTLNPSMKE